MITVSNLLLGLPTSVGHGIFSQWLEVGSLGKLDCAYCSRNERTTFLQTLGDTVVESVCLHIGFKIFNKLHWMTTRNVKCIELQCGLILDHEVGVVAAYINLISTSLKSVRINSNGDLILAILNNIAAHSCSLMNLTISLMVGVLDCLSPLCVEALGKVLKSSEKTLTQVKTRYILVPWENLLSSNLFYFPVLRSVEVPRINDGDLIALSKAGRNLQELILSTPICTAAGCTALGQHCPELRFLTISNVDTLRHEADAAISAIAQGCRKLQVVKLSMCHTLTDVGLTAIATHCTQLTEVSISDNHSMTDAPLITLASTVGSRLKSLSLEKCGDVTGTGIVAIVTHCTALHTLKLLAMDRLTYDNILLFIPHLGSVRELAVPDKGDSILTAIAQQMPLLEKLTITDDFLDSDPFAMLDSSFSYASLLEIAIKCEKLKFFSLNSENAEMSRLAVELWKHIRPNLQIIQNAF